MIDVEHLTKTYGDRVVVDDIGFRVEKGEIVGFLGPNGAGKSTTLRMLTGYLVPNDGRIRIAGVDAVADPVSARRSIGYMPESVPLYPEMRVGEYLRYRAELKGIRGGQLSKCVDAALEKARVADVRSRIIGQLSKGYRSRVGLADALVADPQLLILDEPTAGLDPNQIRQVRDLIRSMAGEKTVLVSTHILPEVESTCSRVLIINKGRLVGEGTPDTLRTTSEGGQVLVLLARSQRSQMVSVAEEVEGVRRVLDAETPADGFARLRLEVDSGETTEALFMAFAKAGLPLRELHREQTSLEDVFTNLTTREGEGSPDTVEVPETPLDAEPSAEPKQKNGPEGPGTGEGGDEADGGKA